MCQKDRNVGWDSGGGGGGDGGSEPALLSEHLGDVMSMLKRPTPHGKSDQTIKRQ